MLTPSNMLALNTKAPNFSLPDPSGKKHALTDQPHAKGYLIVFTCNHCPYVVHIQKKFSEIATRYQEKGIAILGINSNDIEKYPADSPAKMAEEIKKFHYTFPYLFDATQEVARAYQAACTPDFFLFDATQKLVYRGQFDDSRPGNQAPVTGKDLTHAMDEILAGKTPSLDQRPSIGCNIKWK